MQLYKRLTYKMIIYSWQEKRICQMAIAKKEVSTCGCLETMWKYWTWELIRALTLAEFVSRSILKKKTKSTIFISHFFGANIIVRTSENNVSMLTPYALQQLRRNWVCFVETKCLKMAFLRLVFSGLLFVSQAENITNSLGDSFVTKSC